MGTPTRTSSWQPGAPDDTGGPAAVNDTRTQALHGAPLPESKRREKKHGVVLCGVVPSEQEGTLARGHLLISRENENPKPFECPPRLVLQHRTAARPTSLWVNQHTLASEFFFLSRQYELFSVSKIRGHFQCSW